MKAVVYHNYSNYWTQPSTYGGGWYSGAALQCGPNGVEAFGASPCHVRNVLLLGLSSGAVGPTPFQFSSMYLTPTAKTVLAHITEDILNGSISVPEVYTYTPP